MTSLYDGIAAALDHLKDGDRDKKVLILISDGGDNASKHTLAQVIDMAKQSTAIIYTIGIFDEQDGDQNPDVLRHFAKETGGEAFFPESPKEIPAICEGIARDIRNQYTLTYAPTIPSQDGKYRSIDVKAAAAATDGCLSAPAPATPSRSTRTTMRNRARSHESPDGAAVVSLRGRVFLRWTHWFLFIAGAVTLAWVALSLFQARLYQQSAGSALDAQVRAAQIQSAQIQPAQIQAASQLPANLPRAIVKEGEVLGRMEISRLG